MSDVVKNVVWLDLETTGLEPTSNFILEVGMTLMNRDFEPVADFQSLVHLPHSLYSLMDDYVTNMHTENGLLRELEHAVLWGNVVEQDAIEWLVSNDIEKPMMGGQSIHFDRAFLKVHMPELERAFHYRNVDTSVFKYSAEMLWHPDDYESVYGEINAAGDPHRVLGDNRVAIKEFRASMQHFKA